MAIKKKKIKPVHEMNLSELSHENVRLSAELKSCQQLIEQLQRENLMLRSKESLQNNLKI